MKKVLYILAAVLEAALLIGACVVNYFTRRKMGMARYVIYKNRGWEQEYPMDALKTGTMIGLAILTVLVLVLFVKKRNEVKRIVYGMNLVMVALTALYEGFTIIKTTEVLRAYYFISVMFAVAAFIQIIKTFIGIMVCNNEK